MNMIQEVGTWGLYVSAGLTTLNVCTYAATARFWRSWGGWHMFLDMLLLAWILDLLVVALRIGGDPPWLAWIRTLSFALGLPAMFIWRLWIILDLQWKRRPVGGGAYRVSRQRAQEEVADGPRRGTSG